ncbi:hypothetical protein LTR85_000452 [Meristemomyces frigidus]|nr:hypothetical protein LTR85_000452 [Meristemomyces frigidus]
MAHDTEDTSSIGSRIYPLHGGPEIRIERPSQPRRPSDRSEVRLERPSVAPGGHRPSRTYRYSYEPESRRENGKPVFESTHEPKERHYPRHRDRRKASGGRHETEGRQHGDRTDEAEDVLNAYYGGTSMGPKKRHDRYSRVHGVETMNYGGIAEDVIEGRIYSNFDADVDDDDEEPAEGKYHLSPPSNDVHRSYWRRAGRASKDDTLEARICLIVPRHGNRHRSHPFHYITGPKTSKPKGEESPLGPPTWDDARLAQELKRRYASLKTREIGIMQKVFAYKKIAYIYVLQSKCLRDATPHGHWEIVDTSAITSEEDGQGRDNFMYKMRYPRGTDRVWTQTIDNFIVRGAVIELEVVETFDGGKIYWLVLLAVLLSLGAGLGYGFAMGNDFGTGFSIASWILTAFGFFAAVIAAGEYFGLEKPTSFQAGSDLEKGMVVPDEFLRHSRRRER